MAEHAPPPVEILRTITSETSLPVAAEVKAIPPEEPALEARKVGDAWFLVQEDDRHYTYVTYTYQGSKYRVRVEENYHTLYIVGVDGFWPGGEHRVAALRHGQNVATVEDVTMVDGELTIKGGSRPHLGTNSPPGEETPPPDSSEPVGTETEVLDATGPLAQAAVTLTNAPVEDKTAEPYTGPVETVDADTEGTDGSLVQADGSHTPVWFTHQGANYPVRVDGRWSTLYISGITGFSSATLTSGHAGLYRRDEGYATADNVRVIEGQLVLDNGDRPTLLPLEDKEQRAVGETPTAPHLDTIEAPTVQQVDDQTLPEGKRTNLSVDLDDTEGDGITEASSDCIACGLAFTREDFEGGNVKRCPEGRLFHNDTVTNGCLPGSKCPTCGVDLSGDQYTIHDEEGLTESKDVEHWNPEVPSPGWNADAAVRQMGELCYAAAAAIAANSLGSRTTQFERAHAYAMSPQADPEDWVNGPHGYRAAYNSVNRRFGSHAPTTVVHSWMQASDQAWIRDAYTALMVNSGSPEFSGTTVRVTHAYGKPAFEVVREAIDAGHLIMAADSNHWRVIIGYQTSNLRQRVLVSDPQYDGKRTFFYDAFTIHTYYIVRA
ncbi:hypothetical protein [Streptomyces sp. NPDC048419]|uniref:hypothetical protein n=1 Tax=Streptomyces sp. NPDC048419 TaxID=3365547 RepID=UPI00371C94FD